MHEHVLEVASCWDAVVFCSEPSEALVAQVCLDRVETFDEHIQSQVELLLVDQDWRLDVTLHQKVSMAAAPQVLWYIFEFLNEEDALATFTTIWLANERELWVRLHVLLERRGLLRQLERDRRETKLLLKCFTHAVCDGAEDLLACQVLDAWVTIPIEFVFCHFLVVLVIERESEPVQVATGRRLLEAIFVNDVL